MARARGNNIYERAYQPGMDIAEFTDKIKKADIGYWQRQTKPDSTPEDKKFHMDEIQKLRKTAISDSIWRVRDKFEMVQKAYKPQDIPNKLVRSGDIEGPHGVMISKPRKPTIKKQVDLATIEKNYRGQGFNDYYVHQKLKAAHKFNLTQIHKKANYEKRVAVYEKAKRGEI